MVAALARSGVNEEFLRQVTMNFDRLAPVYRPLEWLLAGKRLQRCRTVFLPQLASAQRVLVAGVGHGRWLQAAAAALPEARFTAVDASAVMLRGVERRWRQAGEDPSRLTLLHARFPEAVERLPLHTFDTLVTCFFLDCFMGEELAHVVAALAACAAPHAAWLVCDFRRPAKGPARWRAQAVLWLAYRFFRLTTGLRACGLEDPAPLLRAQGFCREQEVISEWGLLSASLWRAPGLPLPAAFSSECLRPESPAAG